MSFKLKLTLDIHKKKKHEEGILIIDGKRVFKCEECGKIFKSKIVWREHVQSIHGTEKPFKCTESMCLA